MRLNSLHNTLYVATKLLRAELIAVKLIPTQYVDWPPADIAVGETSQLGQFNWSEGKDVPPLFNSLQKRQSLFGVADALSISVKPDTRSVAIVVDVTETVLEAMPGQFLSHERRGSSPLPLGTLCLAISLEENSPCLDTLLDPKGASDLLELILGVCTQSLWGIYHSAMLSQDDLTALPGPAELHHRLQLNLAKLSSPDRANDPLPADVMSSGQQFRRQTLLVLIEIDNFSLIRRQRGSRAAEVLLKRLAAELTECVRKNDGLFRYSDSVFALTANISERGSDILLEKLKSAWRELALTDHFVGLTSSIGYSTAEQPEKDSFDQTVDSPSATHFLIGAEHALSKSRQSGGNQVTAAPKDLLSDLTGTLSGSEQYADGVFSSDPLRDQRNSRILWRTTSLIADETNAGNLCRSFVALLQDMLGIHQADIFIQNHTDLYSQTQRLSHGNPNQLAQAYRRRVQDCLNRKAIEQFPHPIENLRPGTAVVIPLVSRDMVVGALLIETEVAPDDSDLLFLQAIANQIAGALDRLDLAATQALLSAKESASLRAEIQELKYSAQQDTDSEKTTSIIAESQQMRDVLAYIEKVAPTDASMLIMGESGAGKEVMAKAIVAASNRPEAPLVTVDCSAITHSLIDSELFGRVKGAFTGANDASPGRIAQADGGTLFLDEIGELPMDVQAKLLRFVQEKEIIAVGDTRRRRIDARIICATNRDLLFESSQGRFRSDLYYRLQVLQVTVPPLRERQADIAPLARSFADIYSNQFGKAISGFTDEAWQKISQYSWPGNVRELQNAIVRATLTAEGSLIDVVDLQFGEELPSPEQTVFTNENRAVTSPGYREPRHSDAQYSDPEHHPSDPQTDSAGLPQAPEPATREPDEWATLTSLLAGQVAALIAESRLDAPVGRWLSDTVVLTAATVSGGVARQAARLLGVPETTLRRQLTKARQNEDNPFQLMSRQWLTSLPALTELLKSLMIQNEDSLEFSEHCQMLLLQQVANHIGDDRKSGAALMGITPPTYARWLERHAIEPQPIDAPIITTKFKLEQKYS